MSMMEKFTKCDSGEPLNPFLHIFMFTLFVLGMSFLFFDWTMAVQSLTLYQETLGVGESLLNLWGVTAVAVTALHTVAFWVRGRLGVELMRICIFGGFYTWLWAGIIYLAGGFWIQTLILCVPNLYFWTWYAVQWMRRKNGERVAFVN